MPTSAPSSPGGEVGWIGGLASPASADGLNRCLRRANRAFNHSTQPGDVAHALLRDARTRCRDQHL